MEGLFSFLLFAVFFYLMMRFGCGAHMGHGGHGNQAGHDGCGLGDDQMILYDIARDENHAVSS